MPTPFRIGTFNVDNLFERGKVFNNADTSVVASHLDDLGDLQKELHRNTYDKAFIPALVNRLSRFIKINEPRGRLLTRRGNRRVVASSRRDWDGFIELKRAKFDDTTRLCSSEPTGAKRQRLSSCTWLQFCPLGIPLLPWPTSRVDCCVVYPRAIGIRGPIPHTRLVGWRATLKPIGQKARRLIIRGPRHCKPGSHVS